MTLREAWMSIGGAGGVSGVAAYNFIDEWVGLSAVPIAFGLYRQLRKVRQKAQLLNDEIQNCPNPKEKK